MKTQWKFEKLNNRIFGSMLAVLSAASFVGGLMGHKHQFILCVFSALLSLVLFAENKKK